MNLSLSQDDLRQIAQAVVAELDDRGAVEAKLPEGRIGYTEAEAAGLLGMPQHVLRDARLREQEEGRSLGKRIGKRWYYAREELLNFLRQGH